MRLALPLLVAGLVLRLATQYHLLGDVLAGLGGGLLAFGILFSAAVFGLVAVTARRTRRFF